MFGKILMAEKERLSFEEALKKLESIVEQLEDEEITLEDSVKLYEEGVKMSTFCTEILEQAELRIEQVNEANTQ
jgi:exodeoxyribonuclease VII small subunit